jgi:ribosomal-protein-alanine N-acetyltransferase
MVRGYASAVRNCSGASAWIGWNIRHPTFTCLAASTTDGQRLGSARDSNSSFQAPLMNEPKRHTAESLGSRVIETSRLRVRPLLESDLPSLLAINSDEETVRFLGHAPWQGMTEAEAWFERMSKLQESGSAMEFVIAAKATGNVIGRCGLFELEEGNQHARLGYILGRPHWRQGYMREALSALIDCAFSEMNLRRLEADVEAQNTASASLLRRLGFTREGILRERWLTNGATMDAEVYGLLRHEWPILL